MLDPTLNKTFNYISNKSDENHHLSSVKTIVFFILEIQFLFSSYSESRTPFSNYKTTDIATHFLLEKFSDNNLWIVGTGL